MKNDPLKEFAQMMAEQVKKSKEISQKPIVETVENVIKQPEEKPNTAVEVSKYLSRPKALKEDIKSEHDRLVNVSNQSDNIPAEPKNIEAQRWNDPLKNTDFVTKKEMNDHYGLFLQRIQQQMATIGGGGEVRLSRLDDVDRSTIIDEGYLNYNASTRKFVFSKLPSVTTTSVTDSAYTLTSTDSYIGINYAGAVEITLPSVDVVNGRLLYIKDESGAAETNPITVLGTVDNDAGGFTLQINNGSITLIYRDGWRIV